MYSGDGSVSAQKGVEIQGQSLDFVNRHNFGATSVSNHVKGKENFIHSQKQENMELYSRARVQDKEILCLKEQIALATVKESQLLNEKYALEKTLAELQMALDEKQTEVITSHANELTRRKGDLEVNLNLLNELKVVEDERNIFTSSMLGILAEYGAWPHVTNAYALSSSVNHLHDQLQLKIRTSHARLAELNSTIATNARNGFLDKVIRSLSPMNGQLPSSYMGVDRFSLHSDYNNGKHLEPADNAPRYVQESVSEQVNSLSRSGEMRHLPNNQRLIRTPPDNNRNTGGHIADTNNVLDGIRFYSGSEQRAADQFSHPPVVQDTVDSSGSEEGPGIEGFQIVGDATPGCSLLGCGYPVRGTSLCMFQWVRHYPDGTRQYIEGATNPDYVVTADDVDKIIAVECIPMDEQGRQGDLVRIFANDNNKITCDEEMQAEIDDYISKGQATFKVLILLDDSENWEPATLFLRRSGFQVKVDKKMDAIISEKYSKDLLIKMPSGLSAQFVLTCSNGSSYPFSTSDDIRMRDRLVLTMRIFQSKAFEERNKNKAGYILT